MRRPSEIDPTNFNVETVVEAMAGNEEGSSETRGAITKYSKSTRGRS